ncbi:hypothetical protein ACWFMI_27030 [Nocardiopsis terrae]
MTGPICPVHGPYVRGQIEHQILLSGLSVLSRLVRQARREENARLHTHLAGRIPTTVHADLLDLLRVHDDARVSERERLRTEPDRVSSPGMVEALDRTSLIAGIGAGKVEVDDVPQAKLEALARYGLRAKAPSPPAPWRRSPPTGERSKVYGGRTR